MALTSNDLLAISQLLDSKLKPLDERTKRLELTLENEVLPRLQNIEACYTSTSKRYIDATERIEAAIADVELLKRVVSEHSDKLQGMHSFYLTEVSYEYEKCLPCQP